MNKHIKTKDKDFCYLEFGKKERETILLLHGYADSASLFKPLGLSLEHNYHVLALDFPMTHKKKIAQNLDTLTEYVVTFVNLLKLRKFIIAGFSLGGLVATEYTYRNPLKVSRLYLLNSLPQLIRSRTLRKIVTALKPTLVLKPICLLASVIRIQIDKYPNISPKLTPDTITNLKTSPLSIFGTLFNILDSNLVKKFNSVLVPKTIVLFKDDHVLKLQSYQDLLKTLKSRIVLFDKGGHVETKEYWDNVKNLWT